MTWLTPVVALATTVLGACAIGTGVDIARGKGGPVGTMQYTAPGGETVDFAPMACRSGEHHVFLGVDFLDAQGHTARLFVDPLGAVTLRFFVAAEPTNRGLVFARSECEPFKLSMERTGWEIDRVYDLKIALEFACRNSSGATASGTLSASHCH